MVFPDTAHATPGTGAPSRRWRRGRCGHAGSGGPSNAATRWPAWAAGFGLFLAALGGAAAAEPPPEGRPAERGGAASEPANLVGHGGPVKAVEVAPGGRRALTGSFDYSMIHWDLAGERPAVLRRFPDHDAAVNAVRLLPDGRRALSAGDDGALRLWDLESGALLHRFDGHTAKIADLALAPDGALAATGGWDRTARLWHLERRQPGPILDGHGGPVNAVVLVPSGGGRLDVFTAAADGMVRAWDATSGELRRVVYRHGWGINALKALPQPGKLLFGAVDGTVGVLDTASGEVERTLQSHDGPVLALTVLARPGLAASGGGDGAIRVWTSADWRLQEEYANPYGPIWGLAFAPEGDRLYHAGLDDFVTVWRFVPRQPFETVASPFPRRFQVTGELSLGERQFARKCSVCHTLQGDDGNRAGPTLFKVFGRRAGSLPGYPYSEALKKSDIVWTEETIGALFELGPEHVTPGTKMPLQKMANDEEREALIAYLKSATEPGAGGSEASPTRER